MTTIKINGQEFHMSDESYALVCEGAALREVEAKVAAYREARDAYYAAAKREDAAFGRYWNKVQSGERTNGAAVARLSNITNEKSCALYSAMSDIYALDIDPHSIDDADGVERSPVGGSAYS